jgi:hypothetical protein
MASGLHAGDAEGPWTTHRRADWVLGTVSISVSPDTESIDVESGTAPVPVSCEEKELVGGRLMSGSSRAMEASDVC